MNDPHKNELVETDQPTENVSPGPSRPARRRWYRRPKTWFFMLLFCFVINLCFSVVPIFRSDKPVCYLHHLREESPRHYVFETITEDGSQLTPVTLPSILIHDHLKVSSRSNHDFTGGSRSKTPFLGHHVAVFNLSDDPLMCTTARCFAENLVQRFATVTRVDYYPAGETIAPGARLPDFYIYLNDPSPLKPGRPESIQAKMLPGTDYHYLRLKEQDLWTKLLRYADFAPGVDHYELNLSLFCGSDPFGKSPLPVDSLTPPILDFKVSVEMLTSWKGAGIGLPLIDDNRWAQTEGISLLEKARDEIVLSWEKNWIAPPLPESLYPSYREADPTIQEIVDLFSFTPSVIGHSLMTNNDSTWVRKPNKNFLGKLLTQIQTKLEAADWKITSLASTEQDAKQDNESDSKQNTTSFVAKKGAKEVFIGLIPKLAQFPQEASGKNASNNDGWIGIRYRDRMSRKEIALAIKQYITEKIDSPPKAFPDNGPSPEQVIKVATLYEPCWQDSPEVSRQIRKKLEELYAKPSRSYPISALLLLARIQYNSNDKETAFQTLRQATIVSRFSSCGDNLDESIKKQAAAWEQKDLINRPFSRQELKSLGFKELGPDFQRLEFIVNQDEPICLFAANQDSQAEALILQAAIGTWNEKQQKYQKSSQCHFRKIWINLEGDNSSSSMTGDDSTCWQGASETFPDIIFKAEPTNNPEKIKVTAVKKEKS